MNNWLNTQRPKFDHEPRNGEEMSLSRVGKELYEKVRVQFGIFIKSIMFNRFNII